MNFLAFGGDATDNLNEQMSTHLQKMKTLTSPIKKKNIKEIRRKRQIIKDG